MNQYMKQIKKIITDVKTKLIPPRGDGQTKEEYRNMLIVRVGQTAVFLFAALAIIRGAAVVLPDSITVSSSVNGRELPIYCVETDKKQIALTFDAAWGNS